MKQKTKNWIKSKLNINGILFLMWGGLTINIALMPVTENVIYHKLTWLLVSIFAMGIWGLIWDLTSDYKLKELEKQERFDTILNKEKK